MDYTIGVTYTHNSYQYGRVAMSAANPRGWMNVPSLLLLLLTVASAGQRQLSRERKGRKRTPEWWKAGTDKLSAVQRLGTNEWLKYLSGGSHLVVQIGAHDHKNDVGNLQNSDHDPAVAAIRQGWRAVLIEPMPDAFSRLSHRYASDGPRVKCAQAAACGTEMESCGANRIMWSVDSTNATGNWGSTDADARCVGSEKEGGSWLPQIASLSRAHLVRQQVSLKKTPNQCRMCAERLGHPLPPNCLRHVVRFNIKTQEVPCMCLSHLLQGETRLELLVVDAEGFDSHILGAWPFERWRPWRIAFEAANLTKERYFKLAKHLLSQGYVCMHWCSTIAVVTTWHQVNSTEPLR